METANIKTPGDYLDQLNLSVRPQLRLVYEALRTDEVDPIPDKTREDINIVLFQALNVWDDIESVYFKARRELRA